MMPVEALSTVSGDAPIALATAASTSFTSDCPRAPTSAFALPLLATIARIPLAGRRAAASHTGAARDAFTVKHPAAVQATSL